MEYYRRGADLTICRAWERQQVPRACFQPQAECPDGSEWVARCHTHPKGPPSVPDVFDDFSPGDRAIPTKRAEELHEEQEWRRVEVRSGDARNDGASPMI